MDLTTSNHRIWIDRGYARSIPRFDKSATAAPKGLPQRDPSRLKTGFHIDPGKHPCSSSYGIGNLCRLPASAQSRPSRLLLPRRSASGRSSKMFSSRLSILFYANLPIMVFAVLQAVRRDAMPCKPRFSPSVQINMACVSLYPNSWAVLIFFPHSSGWVANEFRRIWEVAGLLIPAAFTAQDHLLLAST